MPGHPAEGPDDRLLAALEGGALRSGAEIAALLGVSRNAVWKAIERLRARGYRISASAGRGYRLEHKADRLLPAEIRRSLAPGRLGGEIVYRESLDSTNRLAAELARAGAAEGTCVVAEQQTAGRGRLGRTWSSPAFLNLYLSVVLRPALPPIEVPRLTLVAAIAVAEAIDELGLRPEIKWPNDVLLDGRKAAGILTELEAEAERVRFVVLGIGVNLNAKRSDFPPELRAKATSLALAAGRPIDRAGFTGRLLGALDRVYGEFLQAGFDGALRRRYERFHALPGRRVVVEGARRLAGVVRGIDRDGALELETEAGLERVFAGEVTLEGSYAGAPPRLR